MERKGLRIRWDGGIFVNLEDTKIFIDPIGVPREKPDIVIVSHAHRDHYSLKALRSMNAPILMSEPTQKIIYHDRKPESVLIVRDEFNIGDISLKFIDSGHIIGSKGVLIEGGMKIFYTGDFTTEKRTILNPLKPVECDILITEATYGAEFYNFPEREELYDRLLELVGKALRGSESVYIGARTLGTAQEIFALLSREGLSDLVSLEPRICRNTVIHSEYEEIGKVSENKENIGIILSSIGRVVSRIRRGENAIVCTGLSARWRMPNTVPLSSHEDMEGLLDFVERTGAKKVYTIYGHHRKFAKILRRRGIEARSLEDSSLQPLPF